MLGGKKLVGKNSSKIKILYLMDVFKKYTDEEHILSAKDLCCILDKKYNIKCERKSIYSDIETLQYFGIDIINSTSPKKGYFLGSRELELPETRLLIDAVQAAGFITQKKTVQLIENIKSQLSIYQAETIQQRVYTDNRVKCKNEEIYYNIDLLNEAIDNNKMVKLIYLRHKIDECFKQTIEEKDLNVNPYALIWANDHYYLVGNNPKYDNLMHLRIDRMRKVTILNEKSRHYSKVCEFKDKFDSALYASRMFNMFSGETDKIKLICDNTIYEEIIDRFGDNCVIEKYNENSFCIKTTATLGNGLVSWIMQFGNMIKVDFPIQLKEHIYNKSLEIANLYR